MTGPSGLRCALCHDSAHGLLEGCAGCGVVLHLECRRSLQRCPTLGCLTPSIQVPLLREPPPEPPPPPGFRLARGAAASALLPLGIASALTLGGVLISDVLWAELRPPRPVSLGPPTPARPLPPPAPRSERRPRPVGVCGNPPSGALVRQRQLSR